VARPIAKRRAGLLGWIAPPDGGINSLCFASGCGPESALVACVTMLKVGGDGLTIQAITALLGVLAWPVVALAVLVLLRREITALFGRVREIEGAGTKVSLDPGKVEQIIEQGRKDNSPLATVAKRIVQSAVVLDKREARILRALLDDDGRAIYSYQTAYYRPFLESLMAKGYVRKFEKGFALTQEGQRVTKEYLDRVLQEFETPVRATVAVDGS